MANHGNDNSEITLQVCGDVDLHLATRLLKTEEGERPRLEFVLAREDEAQASSTLVLELGPARR